MSDGNSNAFPQALPREQLFELLDGYGVGQGLTKREHFASIAMQGLLADGSGSIARAPDMVDLMATAERAVKAADALLAELAK